ncbi:uncharacterized protein AB675_6339 [Cyphellophora attinorum]|uniref:AB hydrolase-1 domain-containing protein n=1 Tax=Cyphellophora attinorum TaxID=1664694 RepID=A0A0N0NQN9_9EURO|nr:uncharacterized protein AB675_6339 [Phialophora attinorum]KPI44131.1 hypothetical protein AB675_6339 [Phialophora attinorum]
MVFERLKSTVTTKDGIEWYYEQEGVGPHVVLIPDGLGECQMMDKPMSLIASAGFTVTTFDMPGMSRSSNAPVESYKGVTGHKLATQLDTLMEHLEIAKASFWGCSAGALAVLGLCAHYPSRVRNAMPHEAPLHLMDQLKDLPSLDDETLIASMAAISKASCRDDEAWNSLGPEVHQRLRRNFIRWAHGYISDLTLSPPIETENLRKRPISWTVGADSPMFMFFSNVVTATKADIPIKTLPGGHFPYVSHPEQMSKHIVEATRSHLP